MHVIQPEVIILDKELYADQAMLPKHETDLSAAVDLRITEDLTLHPGQRKLIGTGLKVWIKQPGVVGLIVPRSGAGHKGTVTGNLVGVIDPSYQGELMISLWNNNPVARVAHYIEQHDDDGQVEEVDTYGIEPLGESESNGLRRYKRGDRVAQMLFVPYLMAQLQVVEQFSDMTSRSEGGFGSTGVR